jgi:anti-sigma factor RsiW
MTRTLTCRDGVRALMDVTEGRLPARRRRAVEAHVGGCRRCQGFVASYGATPGILRRATATRLPAGPSRRLGRIVRSLGRQPTS